MPVRPPPILVKIDPHPTCLAIPTIKIFSLFAILDTILVDLLNLRLQKNKIE